HGRRDRARASAVRPSRVLWREPRRLRGAMAHAMAGDGRGDRRTMSPGAASHRSAPSSRCWNADAILARAALLIGPMAFAQHAALAARFGKIVDLNRAYVRLRRVKSPEEIDWLRIGAWLSDRGMTGLRDGLTVGLTERALGDLIERAYMREGGT